MFNEVCDLIPSENIRRREFGESVSIGLVNEGRRRTNTMLSGEV